MSKRTTSLGRSVSEKRRPWAAALTRWLEPKPRSEKAAPREETRHSGETAMTDQSQNADPALLVPASLFPEISPPGADRLRILVVGRAGIDLLPQVLRSLANLGLSPLSARQHRHDDGTASLPLEFEPQGQAAAERIARSLFVLPEVRRVLYEESGGGGLFQQEREGPAVAAE